MGDRQVFLLTGIRLAGRTDGIDLVCEVGDRWPQTRLVITSDGLPWRALNLIIALEEALGASKTRSSNFSRSSVGAPISGFKSVET